MSENKGCLFGWLDLFSKKEEKAEVAPAAPTSSTFVPAYRRKYLLTKNELYFYRELKQVADKLGLSVLAKVRMADLVEPQGHGKQYSSEFAKIKAKHVDFALCKPENMYVVLLIELDDNSHQNNKAAERDCFVETVYEMTGYKLYRAKGTADLEKNIRALLEQ